MHRTSATVCLTAFISATVAPTKVKKKEKKEEETIKRGREIKRRKTCYLFRKQ